MLWFMNIFNLLCELITESRKFKIFWTRCVVISIVNVITNCLKFNINCNYQRWVHFNKEIKKKRKLSQKNNYIFYWKFYRNGLGSYIKEFSFNFNIPSFKYYEIWEYVTWVKSYTICYSYVLNTFTSGY